MQNSSLLSGKNTQLCRWQTFMTQEELNKAAANFVVKSAERAIASRGRFIVALAGGTTPKSVYELLRSINTDWTKWHIYYGDERCLSSDHADRNSLMAEQAWLNHVTIPANQIHPIPAELGSRKGAAAYAEVLANIDFDLVLLGLGEDGHTASLFPGQAWDDGSATISVENAPKPPPERVSVSSSKLSGAQEVLFMVSGAGKQQAVNDWRAGLAIPVSAITPKNGVDIYCCGVSVA